jgi:acyl carrier protein
MNKMHNDIEKIVLKKIKKLGIRKKITKNFNFSKDSDLDSLSLLNLLIDLEQTFKINFATNNKLNIETYGGLIETITKIKK